MKKFWNKIFLAIVGLSLTASCTVDSGEDIIWDFSPIVVSIKVLDTNGYSVLNSANVGNITATYRGKSYPCTKRTRYYMPTFYGLTYSNDYLLFGELDATNVYDDEQLAIDWGNGSQPDIVTFSHRIRWKGDKPVYEQTFRLNGEVVNGQITIHKDLKTAEGSSSRQDISLSDSERGYISHINDFGLDIARQIAATSDAPDASFVVSPLSVAYAVAMLSCGAGLGEQEQMEVLRAFTGEAEPNPLLISADVFNKLYATLIESMPLTDTSASLYLAHALFLRNDFTLYAGYPDFLARYYAADYALINFNSPEALTYINDWGRQKTHGLASHILGAVNPDDVAYFLSALYLKAPWSLPFEEEKTTTMPFTKADGTRADIRMMQSRRTVPFASTESYEATRLPFGNGAFEMIIMLPAEGSSPSRLLSELTASQISQMPWQQTDLDVFMPSFSITSCHSQLIDQLHELGIRRMFSSDASFTSITPTSGFSINLLQQTTGVAINENGCYAEEGSATASDNDSQQDAPSDINFAFTANHPFLFLIREASSEAILFVGTYSGPQATDNEG